MTQPAFEPARGPQTAWGFPFRCLFVGGCPRSGTTLMQAILMQTGVVATAPETHLFPQYVEQVYRAWEKYRAKKDEGHRDVGLHKVLSEQELDAALRQFCNLVLTKIAGKKRKPFVCEKTPENMLAWRHISRLYPSATIVHVVRDPRGVVASTRAAQQWAAQWAHVSVEQICQRWMRYLAAAEACKQAGANLVEARSAASEEIIYRARAGDRLFLCMTREGTLLALFCATGSSIEQQLLWLFGLELTLDDEIHPVQVRDRENRSLDITARYVLELVGIEVIAADDQLLDKILAKFGEDFPNTKKFSEFARKLATGVDCRTDPDGALVAWMDLEERLFMTLEHHLVGRRLATGFMLSDKADVDGFIKFSLTVQNRRKSRAGWAFGNHIEAILAAHNVTYAREATTEKRNGPDFLFPGEMQYHDPDWPAEKLLVLAAKTSCKDRWRQVLAEADRIERKHLLTLEPGISPRQTDEMRKEFLQLVLPSPLHGSYRSEQRPYLLSLGHFISLATATAS